MLLTCIAVTDVSGGQGLGGGVRGGGVQCLLKGNSHQKLSVANMIEFLPKSFSVYHSPMFEAWKVPKRPIEVSCDVTQHLLAYRTAVENWTNSSGMRTHTGQHSRLPCMHALNFS